MNKKSKKEEFLSTVNLNYSEIDPKKTKENSNVSPKFWRGLLERYHSEGHENDQ